MILKLQENHDLISDIAKEESTEAAALPKLLLDLVEQVEGGKAFQKQGDENNVGNVSEADRKEDDLQEEDIAHNLPKVITRKIILITYLYNIIFIFFLKLLILKIFYFP